jgi:hypothetical protein
MARRRVDVLCPRCGKMRNVDAWHYEKVGHSLCRACATGLALKRRKWGTGAIGDFGASVDEKVADVATIFHQKP